MGQGLALKSWTRTATAVLIGSLLAGCGNDKSEPSPVGAAVGNMAKATLARVTGRAAAPAAQPAQVTRADIEKFGIPILRAVIPLRGADALLTVSDAKGSTVTWATTDGTSFTLRDGVLIQTRGLGADLMSSQAPSASALSSGGSHQRVYFFLGADDQTTRRTYDCTVTVDGAERIEIFGRAHSTTKVTEDCVRPQGTISNTFWFEGPVIRKSRQWTSGGIGFIDFEGVVD